MEQEERHIDRMIEQLRKQYRLSITEQEIASYVLTHLQTMPAMTVRDLAMRRQAQSCGSSKRSDTRAFRISNTGSIRS